MGVQDLHQEVEELLELKSKFINSSSRSLSCKTRRNPSRTNALKMIKRKRARRVGREGSRRGTMIEKKVRTLKKLVPNAGSSGGLDGLFKETAEYISMLQMRVRIMQAVVNALSHSEPV